MRFLTLGLLSLAWLAASSAQAMTLRASSRLAVPGPVQVAGLAALPDGRRTVCLGSRLLLLSAGGGLQRSVALGSPCQSLNISPSGTLALTVQDNKLSLWQLADGTRLKLPDLPAGSPLNRVGFLSDNAILLAGSSGIERVDLSSGQRELVQPGQFTALFVAPDGGRAVVGDGQKIQLVQLPELKVLSGTRCDEACPVTGAWFSANLKTATAFAGHTLFGLRDGYPSTTIVRGSDAASGLPLPDNTVLTLTGGNAESRDLQTGRRESTLLAGVQPGWLATAPAGQVLSLSTAGELLETGSTFRDVRRIPLPATVLGGGWDGQPLALIAGGQLLWDGHALGGSFWVVQSMNKTTWALTPDGDGGLQLNVLSGTALQKMPGLRTATQLSVNFWGNTAAVWDDDALAVVSQGGTLLANYTPAAGTLKDAQVTLSPDATRAFVFPAQGEAHVVTLKTGQRAALNAPALAPGQRYTDLQVSGQGTLALLDSTGQLRLLRPNQATPYANLPGSTGMRFSPDNRWLAVPVRDAAGVRVDVLSVQTGKVETSTPTLAELPRFLNWSPDGKRLSVGAGLMDDLNSITVFDVQE